MGIPISEKQYQQRLVDLAHLNHFDLVYHTFDSRRSETGMLDLIIVGHRRLIIAEVKLDGEELTKGKFVPGRRGGRLVYRPGQEDWHQALKDVEGPPEVYVWRPRNWEEAEEVLGRR